MTVRGIQRGEGVHLTIGALAERTGFAAKTIRYYESIGLLPAPRRSDGGYRLYGEDDESRLAFIAKAKQLGLSLDEIRDVLALHDAGSAPCTHVLGLLDEHIHRVDEALAQLAAFRQQLASLRTRTRRQAGPKGAAVCRIIEHVEHAPPEVGALAQRAIHGWPRAKR